MINQEKALEIAKSKLGSLIEYELRVSDGAEDHGIRLYGNYDWEQLWVVSVLGWNRPDILESTFIILIHKQSGEIVYSGYASDEG